MLKPKYVHGLNTEESPKSVLHRLQNHGPKVWPFDDQPPAPPGDDDQTLNWTWWIG